MNDLYFCFYPYQRCFNYFSCVLVIALYLLRSNQCCALCPNSSKTEKGLEDLAPPYRSFQSRGLIEMEFENSWKYSDRKMHSTSYNTGKDNPAQFRNGNWWLLGPSPESGTRTQEHI